METPIKEEAYKQVIIDSWHKMVRETRTMATHRGLHVSRTGLLPVSF